MTERIKKLYGQIDNESINLDENKARTVSKRNNLELFYLHNYKKFFYKKTREPNQEFMLIIKQLMKEEIEEVKMQQKMNIDEEIDD